MKILIGCWDKEPAEDHACKCLNNFVELCENVLKREEFCEDWLRIMLAWYLKFTNSSFALQTANWHGISHSTFKLQKYVAQLSNICHQVLLFKRNVVTAELRHNEINASSTTRTESAKTYAMTYLLTFARAVLSAILCHATHKSINLELQLRRTLSSHVKKATLLGTLKKPRY